MSGPELTVFQQMPGGTSAFRAAMAEVQQMTDKVSHTHSSSLS